MPAEPALPDRASSTPAMPEGAWPPVLALWRWIALAVIVMLACAWLRFELVEPLPVAMRCAREGGDFACALRSAVIEVFANQRIGWIALAAGAFALLTRWRTVAAVALLAGAAAMMLYAVEPGTVAAVAGLLVLLRRPKPASANSQTTAANPIA